MSSFEAEFEKLYEKQSISQKHRIPKQEYYKILEGLKTATEISSTNLRHRYYILKKFEALECVDVENLIKRRKTPDEHPVYYATIEDTNAIISHIATGHSGHDRIIKYCNDRQICVCSLTKRRLLVVQNSSKF